MSTEDDMREISRAIKYTRFGAIASFFVSAFYLFSSLAYEESTEQLHEWFMIALIYLLVGWGSWRKSRGLAVFGLALYLVYDCGDWVRYFFGKSHLSDYLFLEAFFDLLVTTGLTFGVIGSVKHNRLTDRRKTKTSI